MHSRSGGCSGTVDSRRKSVQFQNIIQSLKACLCCHAYCAEYGAHLGAFGSHPCSVACIRTDVTVCDLQIVFLDKYVFGFPSKHKVVFLDSESIRATWTFRHRHSTTTTVCGVSGSSWGDLVRALVVERWLKADIIAKFAVAESKLPETCVQKT